jgi:hypothetical protein
MTHQCRMRILSFMTESRRNIDDYQSGGGLFAQGWCLSVDESCLHYTRTPDDKNFPDGPHTIPRNRRVHPTESSHRRGRNDTYWATPANMGIENVPAQICRSDFPREWSMIREEKCRDRKRACDCGRHSGRCCQIVVGTRAAVFNFLFRARVQYRGRG